MKPELQGFEEVEHTADWAYRIWGQTLADLFIQGAKGLYELAGVQLDPNPSEEREINLQGIDYETLLIAWLNELLHLRDRDNLGGDKIEIMALTPNQLHAKVTLFPIETWIKDIKAATYHDLAVKETQMGWEVTVVLDV